MDHGSSIDLRRLRYFVVVAEEGNFSRAAERLHMAQPPLSDQIKRLEADLEVRLFDRTSRGARLTPPGELLLTQARRLLALAEQTAGMVRRVGEGEVGLLASGFVPSASNRVLPPVLSRFRERYPDVQPSLQEMNPDRLVQKLHEGHIDASFFFLPYQNRALESKIVSREPLVAALAGRHVLAQERQIDLCDLADQPFMLPARYRMPGPYGKVLAACREAGLVPEAVQKEVWLMQTIVALVAGGLGGALVPSSLENLSRSREAYKRIRGLCATVEMGVVRRRDKRTPVVDSFLAVIGETCRERGWVPGNGDSADVMANDADGRMRTP